MTNRLHTFLTSHVGAPLEAVYTRIDEDQLDGSRRISVSLPAALVGTHRPQLRHLTH